MKVTRRRCNAGFRREIKKIIDRLPPHRLRSLAAYVHFLAQPSVCRRIAAAEEAIAAGKGVNWREMYE